MRDFSFIRFKDNLTDALNVGNSPIASVIYYDTIQLLPSETYSQITSIDGGISLQSNFTAEIVNCRGVKLKDVTDNIFSEEFLDSDGNTQIAFEIVGINQDFYNEPVLFKFYDDFVSYYSNPFTVTDEFAELTTFFEYKNYNDYRGIAYTNSQFSQAIRLKCYFTISTDESEIEDYYQISRNQTISSRVLNKSSEKYVFDYIDRFVYDRGNVLLQHEVIYLDGVRVTNKTSFESNDLIEKTNLFESDFSVYKNYNDKKSYEFQIFDGFNYEEFTPIGNTTLTSLNDTALVRFNLDITLLSGVIGLYNKATNELINIFDVSDITVINGDTISFNGLTTYITENGEYYFKISGGLVESTALGVLNTAILDSETWNFKVGGADFLGTDFNNNDFFTN